MEKKKLLLVDDVMLFLQLQISFLGRKNYEIHTAVSGEEALLAAADLLPDLIVLDYVMPGLTGDQVCARLKTDPATRHIPVIVVSSMAGEEATRKCLEAGCSAYLLKPVRRDSFVCTIEEQLGIYSRKCERVPTHLSCRILGRTIDTAGTIRSLSMTGGFIELAELPMPGDVLEIDFHMPEYNNRVVITGRVIWAGNQGGDGVQGAGIQFLEPGVIEREIIRRHVSAAHRSRLRESRI
jgi:CheY-like chemotaxis protein